MAAAPPAAVRPADVLALQRTAGNRVVADWVGARGAAGPASGVVQRVKGKKAKQEEEVEELATQGSLDEDEELATLLGKRSREEDSDDEDLTGGEGPSTRPSLARGAKRPVDYAEGGGRGRPARRRSIDYGEHDPLALAIKALKGDKTYLKILFTRRRPAMPKWLTDVYWAFLKKFRPAHYTRARKFPPRLLSRNHRLADSVIGMIVTVAQYRYTRPGNAAAREGMMAAFEAFAMAVGNEDDAATAIRSFRRAVKATKMADVQRELGNAAKALSLSARNVRPGLADINTAILNSFDANYDESGAMTPISRGIIAAVQGLAEAGVITQDLADQAVRQAKRKKTGETLSSTPGSDPDMIVVNQVDDETMEDG